jgi:hypothetical protein
LENLAGHRVNHSKRPVSTDRDYFYDVCIVIWGVVGAVPAKVYQVLGVDIPN